MFANFTGLKMSKEAQNNLTGSLSRKMHLLWGSSSSPSNWGQVAGTGEAISGQAKRGLWFAGQNSFSKGSG